MDIKYMGINGNHCTIYVEFHINCAVISIDAHVFNSHQAKGKKIEEKMANIKENFRFLSV